MISSNITLSQGISSFAASIKTTGSVTKRQGPEEKISLPKSGKAEAGGPVFNNIQTVNSSSNSVSLSIRVADNAMEKIGRQIEQMKTDLENIVRKTYPPYLSGSEERTKILKSYSAFRRLINQLTIPPDNQGAYGFDIPELSEDATDEEIYDTINQLENARDTLKRRQAGLAEDVAHIRENNLSKGYTKGMNFGYGEEVGLNDGSEYMVAKSMELKDTITTEPVKSLTGAKAQLALLLE